MPGSALVVGASGFLGAELVRQLRLGGWTVWRLVFAGRRWRPASSEYGQPLVAASCSAADIRTAVSEVAFDGVFHLAASGVNPADRDPASLLDGNVHLIHSVLSAMAGRSLGFFLYTGSCAEYASMNSRRLLTEDDLALPGDLYGAAKAAGTVWALALARHLRVPLVCLRVFHIYGPGEAPYRLIPSLILGLERRASVPLTPGEQVRDLLFVEDAAAALIRTAEAGLSPYRVLNVCSSEPVRVRDVGELTAALMGRPAELLQFGVLRYRAGEQMWLVGDNSRLRQATGWEPQHDLAAGISRTIHFLRSAHDAAESEGGRAPSVSKEKAG